jgi:hypothetical protein
MNGSVEVEGAAQFTPVPIAGVEGAPAAAFPQFRLKGYEWRLFLRTAN